jgi:ATP-dependent protease ClpP protease subunit
MKISIRGPIVSSNQHRFYQFYGMEATSPRSVADALAKGNGERAEVEINSGGGEIFAASEIYTALRNYAGGVHIRIVGLAASAASIIAMAGESEMTPTGMMMIHNVQTKASGDYRQMEHTAGTLRDANHAIISAYIAKTGRPEAEIAAMMDAETWITAERAVELGLVDRIMQPAGEQKPLAADFYSGMLSEDALRRAENFLKGQAAEPDFFMPERAQAEAKLKFLKLKGELK